MAGKLKPLDVARLVAPGKYSDGDGLYLVIAGPKSKNWSFRYWINGKERWHGLGSFNDVSLREARIKRDAARQQVRAGLDIVQAKRSAREDAKTVLREAAAPSFQECAERFIEDNWSSWSKKHRAQWPSSLKRYAYPTIGPLKISEIKASHIFELLQPIWVEKAETANRVRGRIETVIAKNIDIDDKEFRNPAELTKQLREKLPKRPKRTQRHHPALPYADAPGFLRELARAAGTAASALQFLIFTVGRTNEVLGARWSEIDVLHAVWRIPGDRMKMGENHSVPLSDAALGVLDKMRNGSQSELIFSNDEGEPFSDMAMLAALKRMNYGHVTVHGFRATFATWAEECTDYPDGVREAALAHKYKNDTTAAYQRGEKLEKRRSLMNDWAQYIGGELNRANEQNAA
ncbi:tyrosine-type recombinase/integrase [Bradyrhizobium sp. AUGA SZCCT0177]|uniref:tyrosine-type recombinase/integrase n=1 Tax=Bradyrhizobium sp. AUGA SZCCT0177 TaxID=2807665 RepID=UPI001BA98F58|nr:integrase arm-type DNA-binding domain-containing protein [Bradyrhizobium sp. AUGA SZCCT0177]MBR1282941.1 tyrosine-type recombinase/integrase [Bradyrhizobium sp. AUGA SZCCT0177]